MKAKLYSIKEFLKSVEQHEENNKCFVDGIKIISKNNFLKDIKKVAQKMKFLNIKKGDLIGSNINKNQYEYFVLLCASMLNGAILCHLDSWGDENKWYEFKNEYELKLSIVQNNWNKSDNEFFFSEMNEINNNINFTYDIFPNCKHSDGAYITKTSGTTGTPKTFILPQCYFFVYINKNGVLHENIKEFKNLNVHFFSPTTSCIMCGMFYCIFYNRPIYIEPAEILSDIQKLSNRIDNIKAEMIILPQLLCNWLITKTNDNLKILLIVGQVSKNDGGRVDNNEIKKWCENNKIKMITVYATTEIGNIITSNKFTLPYEAGVIENNRIKLKIKSNILYTKSPYQAKKQKNDKKWINTNKWYDTKDFVNITKTKQIICHGRNLIEANRQHLRPTWKFDA